MTTIPNREEGDEVIVAFDVPAELPQTHAPTSSDYPTDNLDQEETSGLLDEATPLLKRENSWWLKKLWLSSTELPWGTFFKIVLLISFISLILVLASVFHIQNHIKEVLIYIQQHREYGILIYIGVYTVCVWTFLPGSIVSIAAGFLFKPLILAGAVIIFGDLLGAFGTFIFGRYIFSDWVRAQISKRPMFLALNHVIAEEGWRIVVMLRLTPLPFNLVSFFFSVSSIKLFPFLWATAIGVLPNTFNAVWIGSLVKSLSGIDRPKLGNKDIVVIAMNFIFVGCCVVSLSVFGKRSLRKATLKLEASKESDLSINQEDQNPQNLVVPSSDNLVLEEEPLRCSVGDFTRTEKVVLYLILILALLNVFSRVRTPIISTQRQHLQHRRRRNTWSSQGFQSAMSAPSTQMNDQKIPPRHISYAGRQEIGPFHKSFTSIVGPNGSGKSNVIDALLFVFGYRAHKMRQGKLSELIHSSQGLENLDNCMVEVHFHEIQDVPGTDDPEIILNSHLVISRQAFRSNASKYFINGLSSNYREVTSLLKERGIDLDHKRFLILQGEVESISQMKPKAQSEHDEGLLEYLEDIIGTSKYKLPIEEASDQLEKLNDERSEKLNRVKIVEKEKQSLEGKKAEAEAFLRDENILTSKKSTLYQMQLMECNSRIDIASLAVNECQQKLVEEEERHAHIKKDAMELQQNFDNTRQEYEAIEKETKNVLKELAKCEKDDIHLQEKKKHANTKQKKLAKTLQKDRASLLETKTSIRYYHEDLATRDRELGILEKSLESEERQLEDIRESLKGKTEVFSSQIEEKQKELVPWNEKINSKQSNIDVLQSEYDILKDKTQSIKAALEKSEQEILTLEETRKEKEHQIDTTRRQIENLENDIEKADASLKNNNGLYEEYRSNLADARQKADEAKALLQSSQSRGLILINLLKLRESGRIKGIHNRLGNLGVIDDKYDVAISTACSALNNIVVDSVEDAQACIEYLRKNNLGRATFTALNQLPSMDMGRIETPENVPRLFDLVQPKDKKFAQAFFNALRNTLVAHNLGQANRLAFGRQRWRVVTLDGKLIDTSGTMTGGGTKIMRGAMSSKFVPDVTSTSVEALLREQNRCEEKWKKLQEERQHLENDLREKKEEIPKLKLNLSKLAMDVNSCKKRIADAKKRVIELRQQNKPNLQDARRMEQLQSEINNLKTQYEELKRCSGRIEEEIKKLQKKILEVGGVQLRSQKSKVDDIKEQIDALNDGITTLQVAKTKAEKDIIKLENSIAKAVTEEEELGEELRQLDEDIRENTLASYDIRQKAEKAQDLMDNKKEELDVMRKNSDEKTEIINKIRAAEVEIKNKLDVGQRDLAENQQKWNQWRTLIGKLSLHKIGDEDEVQENELQLYTDDELKGTDKESLKKEIHELEEKSKNAKPNLTVLAEYRQREEEYISRARDLEEITMSRDSTKMQYDELRKQRLDEFMQGFTLISQKLKEMYQIITLGGNAELELVDSLDPFSEGIIFSVMPPKKSWKNISNLSGGEKTLSSLALVFALHHFKPTPLYVMDEIDAALDFRNVSIVANYIKERTKNAQFIIISLRNNMFELADRLVGIYKTNNMTKSISISPQQFTTVLGH
ncbi:hypothetical protein G9A89_021558 [Geosiphon pyriformis]|nr:hypothetical protein G9A89_021558 [Geosiphon pyriformis]